MRTSKCNIEEHVSAVCEHTETVLTASSPDIQVRGEDSAPLQGAGIASVTSAETIDISIDGESVTVMAVRLWVMYAANITIQLFPNTDKYTVVEVSKLNSNVMMQIKFSH